MISTNLFESSDVHEIIMTLGRYSLLEYKKDYSNIDGNAIKAYYEAKMNVHKRQVIVELNKRTPGVLMQAGAMQMMMGPVVIEALQKKTMGSVVKQFVSNKVTGETVFRPHYTGEGLVVMEPTRNYILFEDLENWNGGMVIEDGMFLACDDTVKISVSRRDTLSSAIFGNEGIFNTTLTGKGICVLESPVPQEEVIIVDLENDKIRIDGSMAIAWSPSLEFTVEKATATLLGSYVSGEKLVNAYSGTGRVMIAPIGKNLHDSPKLKETVGDDKKKEEKK